MKSLNFIKMHGLGNDFVIFNSTEKKLHDPKFIKDFRQKNWNWLRFSSYYKKF